MKKPQNKTQWFLADPDVWMYTPKAINIEDSESGYIADKANFADRICLVGESDGSKCWWGRMLRAPESLEVLPVKESQIGLSILW